MYHTLLIFSLENLPYDGKDRTIRIIVCDVASDSLTTLECSNERELKEALAMVKREFNSAKAKFNLHLQNLRQLYEATHSNRILCKLTKGMLQIPCIGCYTNAQRNYLKVRKYCLFNSYY